jgi:threonylcarbamoyladenosine tRNA methylthiotransferase MtaB
MKVLIHTLGCKMNYVDSEKIASTLADLGFVISYQSEQFAADPVDLAVVNTCTVTDSADRKSFKEIRNLAKKAHLLIVTGCGVQVGGGKNFKFPKNVIVKKSLEEIKDLALSLERDKDWGSDVLLHQRTRKVIAIQSGCDTFCSYCVIPFARGASRSIELVEIIRQAQRAQELGYREVVLTGINLAAWGASSTNQPHQSRLAQLLTEILRQTTIERIRLSSLGPEFLGEEFFRVFEDERICDHLHLSIQSGSERILKKMNRGHGLGEIYEIASLARSKRPKVALTTDIIVGFPGESEADFLASCELVKKLALAKVHVFPFSPRKGTLAYALADRLKPEVIKERANCLRKLAQNLRREFIQANLGTRKSVLLETTDSGLTTNYIRIGKQAGGENEIIEVELTAQNTGL